MWKTLTQKEKIIGIFEKLISEATELKVLIGAESREFSSRLIKLGVGAPGSKQGEKPELIIEKLVPESGNAQLQALQDLVLEFPMERFHCRCASHLLGISSEYPYYGFILSFPECIEHKDRRREDRYVCAMPDFVSVEFKLKRGRKKSKVYSLNVHDVSLHGLGILIGKKDLDLTEILKPGDMLKDISCYAESSMIKVDGNIRHLTKIESGKHEGCYIMGIESPEIIDSSSFRKAER